MNLKTTFGDDPRLFSVLLFGEVLLLIDRLFSFIFKQLVRLEIFLVVAREGDLRLTLAVVSTTYLIYIIIF